MRGLLPGVAALLVLGACAPRADGVRVVGQLVFEEDTGCSTALDTQEMSWSECHQFKRRLDPSIGAIVTGNSMFAGALRGLGATIVLDFWSTPVTGGELVLCDSETIQTDLHGRFETRLKPCEGLGTDYIVTGQAYLQFTFAQASGDRYGVVRGVWREDRALDLFEDRFGPEIDQAHAYTRDGKRFAIPRFVFVQYGALSSLDAVGSSTEIINLGRRRLLDTPAEDPFDYLSLMLSGWQSVLELHQRIRNRAGDADEYYDNMFSSFSDPGWDNTYRVSFDDTWARAGKARMSLFRPDRDRFEEDGDAWDIAWLISSVATLSHEIGHSLHAGYAGSSFISSYSWSSSYMNADGDFYDSGHSGSQYQEVGVAMAEGLASAMGQHLQNDCARWKSNRWFKGGVGTFANNMWNLDASCDDDEDEPECSYHRFRYHMTERGVVEDDSEWDLRKDLALGVTADAVAAGHKRVTSNSETRIAQFGCDLLDNDPDVNHATGKVGGQSYMSDFTYRIGQAFDRDRYAAVAGIATYDADPTFESVHLQWSTFLTNLEEYCKPECTATFPGGKDWGTDYNEKRLSTLQSPIGAHRFLTGLEDDGYISRLQSRELLKSNLMEEL